MHSVSRQTTREAFRLAVLAMLAAVAAVASCRAAEVSHVVRVIDGDTVVLEDGRHVRLMGIDAPEIKQASGTQARDVLEVLALDRPVELVETRSGAYRRTDAVIKWRGRTINEVMLSEGWAWMSPTFCPASHRATYKQLQEVARETRRGLWLDPLPVAPWDFRQHKTESSTEAVSVQEIPLQCSGST